MKNLLTAEPVALGAFVRAVLVMLAAFGLALSGGQIASVVLVVELGVALWTRKRVTPEASAVDREATAFADGVMTAIREG